MLVYSCKYIPCACVDGFSWRLGGWCFSRGYIILSRLRWSLCQFGDLQGLANCLSSLEACVGRGCGEKCNRNILEQSPR
jgi:hypothetical protein